MGHGTGARGRRGEKEKGEEAMGPPPGHGLHCGDETNAIGETEGKTKPSFWIPFSFMERGTGLLLYALLRKFETHNRNIRKEKPSGHGLHCWDPTKNWRGKKRRNNLV